MKDFFILDNGVIKAKLLFPQNAKYTRTRFNHSGFISDIWYKNQKFSEYERSQEGFPTTEGSGLCCSYEPFSMENGPIEMQPVLMPGAGVMIWGDKKEQYEPLDTRFCYDETSAVFETQSPDVNGYSYYEKREIALCGDEITEKVTFRNTGSKRLENSEYGHNFLSLAGIDISPDYQLQVFCVNTPDGFSDNEMICRDGVFTFTDYPERTFFYKTYDTKKSENEYAWIMKSKETGISCYEKIDFTPVRVQVWGDYYVLCCEVFVGISLDPGEEISWTRTWGFSDGN